MESKQLLENHNSESEAINEESKQATTCRNVTRRIFIAVQGGGVKQFTGNLMTKVGELKRLIEYPHNYRLLYNNKVLEDDLTLFDYNVQNESTIKAQFFLSRTTKA